MGHTITLLGGAGMMGRGIARDLLSDLAIAEIDTLRVCDMTEGGLSALAGEMSDPRLVTQFTDVSDETSLAAALNDADLCINAVPTLAGHQMRIFEASRSSGIDYCDLGGLGTYTVKQLEHAERFRDSGVTAVLGVGADPGLSNVICRAVADKLDTIDSIHLYWAAELVGPENPVLVPPYSVSTVLAEYAHPSTQFLDGAHVECPPLSGRQTIDLPDPWGRCEFMFSPHSEQLTVPLAPGIAEKGIRDFTWRLHLPHREHEAWVGLVKAGFGAFDRPVTVNGQEIRPLDVLNAVIARNMAENERIIPEQESHEIHFAVGNGTIDGQDATVRCEAIVRPDPIYDGYVDAGTSMNASIAAQLMLLSDPKPGVWAAESYFDPERYFAQARKRKIAISLRVNGVEVT